MQIVVMMQKSAEGRDGIFNILFSHMNGGMVFNEPDNNPTLGKSCYLFFAHAQTGDRIHLCVCILM